MKSTLLITATCMVLGVACASSNIKMINNETFINSSICKKYDCKIVRKSFSVDKYKGQMGSYEYKVSDKKSGVSFKTYISTGGWDMSGSVKIKNYIWIDTNPGSLYYSPSLDEFLYFKSITEWATGIKLDLKSDLWGTMSLVPQDSIDAAEIVTSKIGSTPVTIYIKSSPNLENPKAGKLQYGIIYTEAFPPLR